MSLKSILKISSYTVSKLRRFFETQCIPMCAAQCQVLLTVAIHLITLGVFDRVVRAIYMRYDDANAILATDNYHHSPRP